VTAEASLFTDSTNSLEKSVIGGVLCHPEYLVDLPWLSVSHFAGLKQRAVWTAIRNLDAKGKAIDALMVCDELERIGKVDAVGGMAELGLWILEAPTLENCIEYASQVREHSLHRSTLLALSEAMTVAKQGKAYGTDLLVSTQQALNCIEVEDCADRSASIGQLAKEHVKLLERTAQIRAEGGVQLTGVPTGVERLDEQIGGWQFGIVSIVCGRPGHGKSSLMLATADIASKQGYGVHVFSLEDPRQQYMNRALARISGVPIGRISSAVMSRDDMSRFAVAQSELTKSGRRWLVDDSSGVTADEVVRSVRRNSRENNTKVVIVDYLQLLRQPKGSRVASRHEMLGETLHVLADAAKNDGIAYLVGSQLNRGVESRSDKRPVESDLRESGTIEERAKCIIGMYRGAKYSETPVKDIDVDDHGHLLNPFDFERTVQLMVLKNSQGPAPGRVLATWNGPTTRVS